MVLSAHPRCQLLLSPRLHSQTMGTRHLCVLHPVQRTRFGAFPHIQSLHSHHAYRVRQEGCVLAVSCHTLERMLDLAACAHRIFPRLPRLVLPVVLGVGLHIQLAYGLPLDLWHTGTIGAKAGHSAVKHRIPSRHDLQLVTRVYVHGFKTAQQVDYHHLVSTC